MLGSLIRLRSPPLEWLNTEELEAVEALGRNWEFLNGEATTEGDYTPTGPRYVSPKL